MRRGACTCTCAGSISSPCAPNGGKKCRWVGLGPGGVLYRLHLGGVVEAGLEFLEAVVVSALGEADHGFRCEGDEAPFLLLFPGFFLIFFVEGTSSDSPEIVAVVVVVAVGKIGKGVSFVEGTTSSVAVEEIGGEGDIEVLDQWSHDCLW